MMWAASELEHVGRIAAISDKDIQYSYAKSTVNGMAHLKDAIFQYVNKYPEDHYNKDLLTVHDQVIRVMQHLKDVYKVDLEEIKAFRPTNILKCSLEIKIGARLQFLHSLQYVLGTYWRTYVP